MKAVWESNPRRNVWQDPVWVSFQKNLGRKVWHLSVPGASALVIQHALPFKLNWLEVPRGPLFDSPDALEEIVGKIRELARMEKSVFVRFSSYDPHFKTKGLRPASADHQPEASLVLDLSLSEEKLLEQMKPKGRYNIRVAEKHGVMVESSSDVDAFYGILKKTTNRDGFAAHPKKYYQAMLNSLGKNAQLLLALHQGKVVAGGIFVYVDDWGIYYYGASDHEHRNLMAPYLIQWQAILEAKKRGCKFYDFLGIAPTDDSKHPWAGVTDFKKKFGGQVVHYPRAQELPLRKLWHLAYRLYKKMP